MFIQIIKKKAKIKYSYFQIFFIAFIFIGFISYIISLFYKSSIGRVTGYKVIFGFSSLGFQNLFQYFYIICLSFLILNLFNNKNEIINLVKLFINVGIISSIIGLFIYLLYSLDLSIVIPNVIREFPGPQQGVWDNRLAGTAFEPLAFGNQIGIMIPLTIGLFILCSKDKLKYSIYLFIEFLTLILTFSSGAWISTFVSVIGFFVFLISVYGRKYINKKIIAKGIAVIGILGFFLIGTLYFTDNLNYVKFVISDKFKGSQSMNERRAMNTILLKTFKEYPVIGVGIGRYVFYIDKYGPAGKKQFKFIPRPVPAGWRANNDYFTILAETGILGSSFFVISFIFIFRETFFNTFKFRRDRYFILLCSILTSICIILIQMAVAFLIYSYYLWILIGLALVFARNYKETGETN
ncbi:O-antigen ligase family protein [Clostridium caldaquaticum]|uniref:O-antigen ligase family protein n=1 Tax=Clostridium caldaquaticum TaxID=2940653 RepID=UPI002076D887|nr:O-antigen ligase family protein [Clostridium caldaquaticum]